MQEYSSISVSSYEAASLADRLTEQAADGWSVVAVVPTGSTVTAYLSREASGDTAGSGDAAVAVAAGAAAAADSASPDEAAATTADDSADAPSDESAGWAAGAAATTAAAAATTEPESAPAEAAPAAAAATETAGSTAAAAGAPAGWYADPSSRFELRYWDGSQWTEHVSRGGQQFTDPPVA